MAAGQTAETPADAPGELALDTGTVTGDDAANPQGKLEPLPAR